MRGKAAVQKLWRDWLSPLVWGLLFTQFAASAVRVDGASMMPTLRHGEWLALPQVEGWAHRLGLGRYGRGDIVVFKPPASATFERTNIYRGLRLPWSYRPYLVKRVVGLPGDTVQMRAGRLYVNGQAVSEPRVLNHWAQFCPDTSSPLSNTPPLKVPAAHYFVMGDNRSPGGSLDSRVFGPVPAWDISSRAVASFWPLLRKEQARPPCDGQAAPERRVELSGEVTLNPRWLAGESR
ncbi:MAG: signal peptidase I [Deinococcus sp.]|uniref:signal peptidase I n=1 Tax=Deinococcus sp. TaxID=47478 RepID=UPI0026DCE012|nr:signal peptidase I [Deinococcus sp.]MDO4247307.1 signal peptidase I [Deinococcus sp.]